MLTAEHPTVLWYREQPGGRAPGVKLDAAWLRDLCRQCGADDVGFVDIQRPELESQRRELLDFFPRVKTLISLVARMNREPIRSPARSVANLEFHHAGDELNEAARNIVAALEQRGVSAVNPAMGFPMEQDRFPRKTWVVSHKPIAVAAGLGRMGIHRNVIHPRYGSFILLGTILLDAEVTDYDGPIQYNPCLECKLCVAACPVGAISADGHFDFSSCYTHNYREFMGGFSDWVEKIADSRDALDYRKKVSGSETVSMWQSLSFGANYKAAYCLAVCPAGEQVIGPYLEDKTAFLHDVVRPLRDKEEPVYVVAGSDAEQHVLRRFPWKTARRVGNGLHPRSIENFLAGLPLTFQRGASRGLDAVVHFTFTGQEPGKATVIIREQSIQVKRGHEGSAGLSITADAATWLGFLAGERSLVGSLLRGRIRLRGSPRLLLAFGRCFPS